MSEVSAGMRDGSLSRVRVRSEQFASVGTGKEPSDEPSDNAGEPYDEHPDKQSQRFSLGSLLPLLHVPL
jgi:hypothetical protein